MFETKEEKEKRTKGLVTSHGRRKMRFGTSHRTADDVGTEPEKKKKKAKKRRGR